MPCKGMPPRAGTDGDPSLLSPNFFAEKESPAGAPAAASAGKKYPVNGLKVVN